jgi:hypothetical protein
MEVNILPGGLEEATLLTSKRCFSNEKGHILAFMADTHGSSFLLRYQYRPLTEVFLKGNGKKHIENGQGAIPIS